MKELILVNPGHANLFVRLVFYLFKRQTPLAFLILSALTPKSYRIRIIDQSFFRPRTDSVQGALIGITTMTASSPRAYRLADLFRQAGATVVMGGPHVSALPEEALKHCRSVVVHEAESVWPQLVRDFEEGRLKDIYRGEPLEDFFAPVAEYFFKLPPDVLRRTGFSITRGCNYCCEFCARPPGGLRVMKIEHVVALVRRIKEAAWPWQRRPLIVFAQENNIFADPAYARQLFRALIPLKIWWVSNSSLSIAFDEEGLRLARESGCYLLFMGFESIDPRRLAKTAEPGAKSPRDYLTAIRRLKKKGIKVFGAFVLGFDEDTPRDYRRLLVFLIKAFFYFVPLTLLTPFPGTRLYERLRREGRLRTQEWSRYDMLFHIVFSPKNMSVLSLYLWYAILRLFGYCFSTFGLVTNLVLLTQLAMLALGAHFLY